MAMNVARTRAYVGEISSASVDEPGLWRAHIENADGEVLDSIDGALRDLVTWARARTGWVLVLPAVGDDDVLRWAGSDPKPDDVPYYWTE